MSTESKDSHLQNQRAPCVDIHIGHKSRNNLHPTTAPYYRDENNKGNTWKDAARQNPQRPTSSTERNSRYNPMDQCSKKRVGCPSGKNGRQPSRKDR